MEAHKPMFALRPADGALGAQQDAVRGCYQDFRSLANRMANMLDVAPELIALMRRHAP